MIRTVALLCAGMLAVESVITGETLVPLFLYVPAMLLAWRAAAEFRGIKDRIAAIEQHLQELGCSNEHCHLVRRSKES